MRNIMMANITVNAPVFFYDTTNCYIFGLYTVTTPVGENLDPSLFANNPQLQLQQFGPGLSPCPVQIRFQVVLDGMPINVSDPEVSSGSDIYCTYICMYIYVCICAAAIPLYMNVVVHSIVPCC